MGSTGSRPTIVEVAKLAGVSHQTVSRYLRFDGQGVREPIQQRIRAAIDELDYRPNLAARAMRTRRTGRLAVLLPDGSAHSSIEVLEGVNATAHEHGYDVDVVRIGGLGAAQNRRVFELAESGLFEGLLSLTRLEQIPDAGQTPVTLSVFGIYDHEMRGVGPLVEASSIAILISQLAELGHRRFLHLAGDYRHESARRRRDAYLETVQQLGLESQGVLETHWQPETAVDAILTLPDDAGVTAIVAANDLLAAAAIRGAHLRGWAVPDQLSVTGFGNNPLGEWTTPSLTSVRIDHQELGRIAMNQLIADLRGTPRPESEGSVMEVVTRESTGSALR